MPGDELQKQVSEGKVSVSGSNDVLTMALGPEHPGRVRGVGAGISPRQYYNLPKPQRISFDDRLKDSLRVLLQEENKKMEAKARDDRTRPNFRFGIRAKCGACPTPGECRAQKTFLPFLLQIFFKIPLDFCRNFGRVSPVSRIFYKTLPWCGGYDWPGGGSRILLRPGGLGRHAGYPSRKLTKSGDYDQPVPPADSSMTPSQLESLWQDAGDRSLGTPSLPSCKSWHSRSERPRNS
ncbi:hypothetical protein Prudu_836S000200 [Prunus dulcis]|uniref:Uncharacterized protein n=1 Tax=Prunus dulcis TaxID=3755 RepID=A0A5H2Y9Q1_PRUDU|nr:hypothetical protein Prudu_836S000200 [Prunus dulcis]